MGTAQVAHGSDEGNGKLCILIQSTLKKNTMFPHYNNKLETRNQWEFWYYNVPLNSIVGILL